MSAIMPSSEDFVKLVQLKILSIKDGKYIYDPEFEGFVNKTSKKGISRIKQLSIGRKTTIMSPIIASYKCFRSQKNIENLLASYVWFTLYMEALKQKIPRHHETLVYSTWYLNDHEPEVLDV